MSRATHGGGIVFKLTGEGPRYLLVESSGTRDRWVFPKGRIEKRESAVDTALREVSEEAGVLARPIRRLRRVEQKQDGDWISIFYFLLAYNGRTKPLEKRKLRWLSFDEAFETLDLGGSRRVLRLADRLISLATGEEPPRHRIRRAATRIAEWLALGALALLFVAPIPFVALPLALPVGILVSVALRILLRPLEGRVSRGEEVPLLPENDRLRLLIRGSEWMTRTDYLGSPIRVAAALALFLPGTLAKSGGWMALGGLVAAVLLSWFVARSNGRLPRSRAAVLGIPALWLGIGLVVHTIAMAGSTLEVASAILVSAVSAVAWWKLERRRAGVLAIIGGSVE